MWNVFSADIHDFTVWNKTAIDKGGFDTKPGWGGPETRLASLPY